MWTFTPITPDDIDALTDIWTTGYQQGHAGHVPDDLMALRTRAHMQARLQGYDGMSLVARPAGGGGDLGGFSLIHGNEIYQFYVARPFQGTGLARQMMAETLTTIANAGYDTAVLDVTPGNDRAAAFYSKMGFKNTGLYDLQVDTANGP